MLGLSRADSYRHNEKEAAMGRKPLGATGGVEVSQDLARGRGIILVRESLCMTIGPIRLARPARKPIQTPTRNVGVTTEMAGLPNDY